LKHQVRIESAASGELEDAIRWYDKQHAGLGAGFLAAVDTTIARIDRWPACASHVPYIAAEIPVRCAPVPRFPYGIVYLLRGDTIWIVAFAHERRKPNYWQTRTSHWPR
jgi:hypothetical protein